MISKHLPKKDMDVVLIQVRVPRALRDDVNKLRKKYGWDWNEIVIGCFKDLLEELAPLMPLKSPETDTKAPRIYRQPHYMAKPWMVVQNGKTLGSYRTLKLALEAHPTAVCLKKTDPGF